jgi:hypothetical protein
MGYQNLKFILFSCIISFLFTAFIYNVDFFLQLISSLCENKVFIHICSVIFYFFLFLFLYKKLRLKIFWIFIVSIMTTLIIDSTVLITNPSLVPLRFPFASIFPVLGAGLGVFFVSRSKSYFGFALAFVVFFLLLTHLYFLPKLYYYSLKNNSQPVSNTFFENKFYTILNEPIYLKDTAKAKCVIIECFFNGCIACEEKKEVLMTLRKQYSLQNLSMIFLCDGKITPFDKFLEYSKKNKNDGIVFLYDKDDILQNKYNISKYPFEIFSIAGRVINTYTGFNETTVGKEYYKEKVLKINEVINEKLCN